MPPSREQLGIIGLGAIGGSLALAIRESVEVLVWSRDPGDREAARRRGLAVVPDEVGAWARAFDMASMIVIAVPVGEIATVARSVLESVPDECVVTHVGSLQSRSALRLTDDISARVIGTHPLAGSERSGFTAARAAMFQGASLRAEARATSAQRARIEALWRIAGITRVVWDEAERHDALMSWVSHLPQLTATALAATLARSTVDANALGSGGSDVTRLAASDWAMWKPLLERAPRETGDALEHLARTIHDLRNAIAQNDWATLAALWEQGRAWKSTERSAP
jgi:prephenate dehydrogenase